MSELVIENITKTYGKNTVLDGVSAKFEKGHSYGLLGRNGAGKSTLINIIMQRRARNGGTVTLDGEKLDNNDRLLSRLFCMNDSSLYPSDFKVKTVFKITAPMYENFDLTYAEKLAEAFGLDMNKRLRQLSTGYNTIYKVILALSSNADYIFLDEPVLGIDVNQRELFYKTLARKMSEGNSCFVISTHIIEEMQNLIEKTLILRDGKIILNDETENILSSYSAVSGKGELVDKFTENRKIICTESMGNFKKTVFEIADKEKLSDIPAELSADSVDLQKVFYYLTGGSPEENV